MDEKQELTLSILATQMKSSRIYEYLLGALLQSEDRTRHLDDMLEYKKKTAAFLEDIDNNPHENPPRLSTEVALNRKLIQAVRSCENELWVNHGYGLPVKRCTSKWIYQDCPSMLSHSRVVNEPLHVLCRHIRDKYDVTTDPVITKLLDRFKEVPDVTSPDSVGQLAVSASDDNQEDGASPADNSDDDSALVVAEETKYPHVARESGQDDNCSGKPTKHQNTSTHVARESGQNENCTGKPTKCQNTNTHVARENGQNENCSGKPTKCQNTNTHVARESGQNKNCTGKPAQCPDTNSLVLAARKAGESARWEERLQNSKAAVIKALGQLNPVLCPATNQHLQEDSTVKPTAFQESNETKEDTSIYLPRSLRSPPTATLTSSKLNAVIRKYVIQRKPGYISRRHLARPLPIVLMAAGTPLDPEFGTSPCGIRASRMTPLRAPVKRTMHHSAELVKLDEEVRDDVPDEDLDPYVKPLFKQRVSHVTQNVLHVEAGEDRDKKWEEFRGHLEAVRQRVIKRLMEQVRVPHKRAAPMQKKQKRRKNKSKRRRKCKKHAKTDTSNTSSSVSLTCTRDAGGDVKATNDASSGEDTKPVDFGVTVNKIRTSGKGKKRRRRLKKLKVPRKSCHSSEAPEESRHDENHENRKSVAMKPDQDTGTL